MRQLNDPNRGVPRGWKYVDPVSGEAFAASNLQSLKDKVGDFYRKNGRSDADVGNAVEDYICRQIPESYCHEEGMPSFPRRVVNFLSSMGQVAGHAIRTGQVLADDVEGKRRLAICAACPHSANKGATCKKCGCRLRFKSYLYILSCPIGKW